MRVQNILILDFITSDSLKLHPHLDTHLYIINFFDQQLQPFKQTCLGLIVWHITRRILFSSNSVFVILVGMTGFEPAAPTTLKWCANRTAPHPENNSNL